MVEHHLAKVRVAGSNPVVRSVAQLLVCFPELERVGSHGGVAEWRGSGLQSRIRGFESHLHLVSPRSTRGSPWAIGAAVARFPDTEEVTGSIPVSPTMFVQVTGLEPIGSRPLLSLGVVWV